MKRRTQEQKQAPQKREIPPAALAGLVLVALLIGLIVAGVGAWRFTSHVEEIGQASDSFGYLQMAKDTRAGRSPSGGEKFTATSDNARIAIDALKKSGIPVAKWEAAVAPAAYHYDPRSDKVINQYPPGIGWLLALFPEGRALAGVYTVVFIVIAAAAVAAALWSFRRVRADQNLSALFAAVLIFLALHAAVMLLGVSVSYSIDFLILVALPAVGFAVAAGKSKGWLAIIFASLSGAAAGYMIVMRVAAALMLPGLALAVYAAARRKDSPRPLIKYAVTPLLAWFGALFLCGILPLMLHQQALTGSMFGATYSSVDVTPIEPGVIGANFIHYFAGEGSLMNWLLFTTLATFALGSVALSRSGNRNFTPWIAAAATLFILPALYFLTHRVTTHYYLFPSVELLALTLAGAAMAAARSPLRAPWHRVMIGAILLGAAVNVTVSLIPPGDDPFSNEAQTRKLALPDEVKNPKAWIFAARFSGTLWWSHGVYAMDIMKGDNASRAVIYKCTQQSAAPIYIFDDRPTADKKNSEPAAVLELKSLGGKAERLPKSANFARVTGPDNKTIEDGADIYRITW